MNGSLKKVDGFAGYIVEAESNMNCVPVGGHCNRGSVDGHCNVIKRFFSLSRPSEI